MIHEYVDNPDSVTKHCYWVNMNLLICREKQTWCRQFYSSWNFPFKYRYFKRYTGIWMSIIYVAIKDVRCLIRGSHGRCNCYRARLECDRSWVEPRSGETKDYKIGICCFSAKHAALRRKNKDWLAWNQDNVWISIRGLLFQWASTIKIQLSVLV